MPDSRRTQLRTRLTGTVLALAMLAWGAIAPAAVVRCDLPCALVGAVDTCAPGGGGAGDESAGCCGRHERSAVPADPDDDAPQKHEHRGSGCCPQACTGCAARSLFVASDPVPTPAQAARPVAPAAPAAEAESLDITRSIFHPPKA
jgi:hypothetical protein